MNHILFGPFSFAKVKDWSSGKTSLSSEWARSVKSFREDGCLLFTEEDSPGVSVNNLFGSSEIMTKGIKKVNSSILHFFSPLKGTRW